MLAWNGDPLQDAASWIRTTHLVRRLGTTTGNGNEKEVTAGDDAIIIAVLAMRASAMVGDGAGAIVGGWCVRDGLIGMCILCRMDGASTSISQSRDFLKSKHPDHRYK